MHFLLRRLVCVVLATLLLSVEQKSLGQSRPPAGGPVNGPTAGPQPNYPQTRQQVPLPNRAPQAPFRLTSQQEADLMLVLRAWEERSSKIKTLWCDFTKWEFDAEWGPFDPTQKGPNSVIPKVSKGEIKYAAPDKGLYRIAETQTFDRMDGTERKYRTIKEGGEHWICDGLSLWSHEHEKKQLLERKLPPELQGQAITDGPLPFLFGAKADKLMHRYYLRIITPANAQGQVWIEAYPKFQLDAANFQRVTLILDQKTLLPFGLELYVPSGRKREVHQFANNVVNDPLRIFKGDFSKPSLPRGWQKVEETARTVPPPAGAQPGAPTAQRPSNVRR